MTTIANMTLDDLKQFILDLLEERRLSYLFGELDMDASDLNIEDEPDHRTLEEVFASVEQNRWTPPAGSPTPAEMLRQNRDEH
ncbi:MAG: hypothetical protein MUE40_17155 [Anaerolineae bacterium]|jgi:hypothetical protein|nr:hypothetical protein [Anaerolineae bacterium]